MTVDADRVALAEAFLQEAVHRSREAQAGAGLWAAGDPSAANCGLGESAAVVLALTPRAEELLNELWPSPPEGKALGALRKRLEDWVVRQDALDRKRNHFLKAFRGEHGFDRSAYDPGQAAAYREGLDAVNGEVSAERREVAECRSLAN